ncbi:MAG: hypothetical protein J6V11_01055 [Alphaproteobacteria bacterium]|nr:hypothetical protein [Alphaproteobacteria bacterium]
MFKKLSLFIFCFCFGFGYTLNPLKPKVHIYIDYATTPALLQMTDFVKQPHRDKKFIFWRRFPNLNDRVNLSTLNTVQINLPESEGKNGISWNIIVNSIRTIYNANPDAEYIIHSNLWWNELLIPILQIIPQNQVKHIHVYEDGLSNVVHSRKHHPISIKPNHNYANDLQNILNDTQKYSHHYDFSFHTLYPTTYHFGFVNYALTHDEFKNFLDLVTMDNIKEINWNKISQSLSPKQKQLIFDLVDFDADEYKKQVAGKPSDFFLLRAAFSTIDEQVITASWLFDNYDKNRILVLKEHPNLTKRTIAKKIQEKIPNSIIFPKHIPFEILILADLMPDTVSVYTTSVFFVIPKEKIKYFITSNHDTYLPFLKELNMLTDKQIINSMKEEK